MSGYDEKSFANAIRKVIRATQRSKLADAKCLNPDSIINVRGKKANRIIIRRVEN